MIKKLLKKTNIILKNQIITKWGYNFFKKLILLLEFGKDLKVLLIIMKRCKPWHSKCERTNIISKNKKLNSYPTKL